MDEDRERARESDHTTIVTTDRGGRGGGTVAVVLLVIVLLVVLFVFFGDRLRDTADEVAVPEDLDVNVNVDAPEIRVPDIEIRQVEPPPPAAEQPPANQGGNAS